MPRNKNIADIHSLVETFATQLIEIVRRTTIEDIVRSIGGGAPARRGPGRPRGSSRKVRVVRLGKAKSKRGRRSSVDLAAWGDKLLAHVKAHPGQRGEQIAAALRTDVGTMRGPMKALIAAKKVSTKGQRRGMTYRLAGGVVGNGKGKQTAKK